MKTQKELAKILAFYASLPTEELDLPKSAIHQIHAIAATLAWVLEDPDNKEQIEVFEKNLKSIEVEAHKKGYHFHYPVAAQVSPSEDSRCE